MTAAIAATGPLPTAPKPVVNRAACSGKAPGAPIIPPPPLTPKQARTTPEDNGRGQSADKTLGWDWKVDKKGGRAVPRLPVERPRYAQVLYNDVPRRRNDRAVRLGAGHLPGDHRSAGLRADLRQPDPRHDRRRTAARWRSARR